MFPKAGFLRTLIFALMLFPFLLAVETPLNPVRAAAQGTPFTALIQMHWPEYTPEAVAYIYFFGEGGEVRGLFYHVSEQETYYGLAFEGTFNGFEDEGISGTISGYIFLKGFADTFCSGGSFDAALCSGDHPPIYQEYTAISTGPWSGKMPPGGGGEGEFTLTNTGTFIKGGSSVIAGTWTVMDIYEGFLDPPEVPLGAPMLSADVPGGTVETVPTETPVPVISGNPAPAAANNASQMDPLQLPAMAGAALAGAVLGLGAAQVGSSVFFGRGSWGRKAAQVPMAYSPATGKLIPADQAQAQKEFMARGYYYRDGEWHAPVEEYRSTEPAYATKQAEAARAENKAKLEQWMADSKKRVQDEELSDFRWWNAYKIRKAEALMNRQYYGWKTTGVLAELAVDVAAATYGRVRPLALAEDAAKAARLTWSLGYGQLKVATRYAVNKWRGEKTKFWEDEFWTGAGLLMRFIAPLNAPTPDTDVIVAQEMVKKSITWATRTAAEFTTGNQPPDPKGGK